MSDRAWLLAIDTSSDWSGVALTNGGEWAELNWSSGRRQTTQVLPEIERLLARMDIAIGDVGAIAVATGPGSFSGLRVGLSLAKGFALAAGRPVIGVSTLAAAHYGWTELGLPVFAVVRAGRNQYVWGQHAALPDLHSGEIADLMAGVPAGAVIVGELDAAAAGALITRGCIVPDEPARRRRASALAAIGWRRWRAGEVDDPATLEPHYFHQS